MYACLVIAWNVIVLQTYKGLIGFDFVYVSAFLREGYAVKIFFQSISQNTNLMSISQCIFTLNSN